MTQINGVSEMQQYDHFTHRHKFGVWAAARAAQRGFTGGSTVRLRIALETCGIVDFVRSDDSCEVTATQFDQLHLGWCRAIVDRLREDGIEKAMYGRAAKLVAVYLKAMVIVGAGAESALARVAHPPVDGILLHNLSRADDVDSPHKKTWGDIKWTKLDESGYLRLVSQLRECLSDDEPFWRLERYWTVTNDTT